MTAPYLRWLIAGFPPRRPGFKPRSGHVGFCDGQKWCWDRFSPRTSVSSANLHSICFSTIIFTTTRGWHNRPGVAAVPIDSHSRIKKKKKTWQDCPSHYMCEILHRCQDTPFMGTILSSKFSSNSAMPNFWSELHIRPIAVNPGDSRRRQYTTACKTRSSTVECK
jgi:hypothetical protein